MTKSEAHLELLIESFDKAMEYDLREESFNLAREIPYYIIKSLNCIEKNTQEFFVIKYKKLLEKYNLKFESLEITDSRDPEYIQNYLMNLIIGLKVFYDAKLDNMGDIYSKEFSFAFFRHYSKLSKKDKNNFMEDYISIMKDIKPTEFGIKQKNIN